MTFVEHLPGHGEYDEGFEPPAANSGLTVRRVSDIRPEPVEWVWRDRLPAGVVTALAGDGGLGKSTLAIHIAAQITRGEIIGKTETRRVGILLCEDSPSAVIMPRLQAAGAVLENVDVIGFKHDGIDGPLTLPTNLEALRRYVTDTRPELLIADPVMGLLDAGVDAHRDGGKGGIRGVLGPLHRLAEDVGTTVIAVFHLNKGNGASSQRIGGSAAIRNAVRNVLMVAAHPDSRKTGDDDGRRLIGHEKSNYGELQSTLEATVRSAPVLGDAGVPLLSKTGTEVTTVVMSVDGESDVDYRDALTAASNNERDNNGEPERLAEAVDFVRDELADGPVPSRQLEREAGNAGITKRTLERARKELGVKSSKTANGWAVSLPGGLGGVGGLGENPSGIGGFKTANAPEAVAALPGTGGWEDGL